MSKGKGNKTWIARHLSDPYVKEANKQGLRSRASFKIIQIQEKDKIFKPGMRILDLGSAPGGWSEMVVKAVGRKGKVIALDRLPMEPIKGVEFLQGDFETDETLAELELLLEGKPVDWILSDMSPNLTGHKAVDQPRSIGLCEVVLDFALEHLPKGGGLLIKIFQGEGYPAFHTTLKQHFTQVITRKPDASRVGSREVYLLAKSRKLV
jgi:23S rRNA (uridine2552-2'-O)-methyltransferase